MHHEVLRGKVTKHLLAGCPYSNPSKRLAIKIFAQNLTQFFDIEDFLCDLEVKVPLLGTRYHLVEARYDVNGLFIELNKDRITYLSLEI